MSRFAINPNAIPSEEAEERAALERDNAHLHHFDDDGAGVDYQVPKGGPPLPPAMFVPDPRYPHGDIDEVEARLRAMHEKAPPAQQAQAAGAPVAGAQAGQARQAQAKASQEKLAQDHPLIASLVAALPPPGATWPVADRATWLKAAQGILALVYPTSGDGQKAA